MTCESVEHAEPYERVDPKRSFDKVPVFVDWHDYLISKWSQGITVSGGIRIRLRRKDSRGLQFRALNDGVSGKKEPVWPQVNGGQVWDGTVQWVAEPVDAFSLRISIATESWPVVTGVTLSDAVNADLVYRVTVAGGTNGREYLIKHQIVLADGEKKEAVAVLLVQD